MKTQDEKIKQKRIPEVASSDDKMLWMVFGFAAGYIITTITWMIRESVR